MARTEKAAFPALLPFVLTGCIEWHHPTKPAGHFAVDDVKCQKEALKEMPPSPHQQPAPKWMNRGLGTSSYMVDANETARGQWHMLCLRLEGWALRAAPARQNVVYTDQYQSGAYQSGVRYSRSR